jgi:hypothetical protein
MPVKNGLRRTDTKEPLVVTLAILLPLFSVNQRLYSYRVDLAQLPSGC